MKKVSDNAKQNPKKFWDYVRTKSKTKPGIPDIEKTATKEGNSQTTHIDQ